MPRHANHDNWLTMVFERNSSYIRDIPVSIVQTSFSVSVSAPVERVVSSRAAAAIRLLKAPE